MIIDDETALELGREIYRLSEMAESATMCQSLGRIAFKLVAPKVLEMIRTPTPAMLKAGWEETPAVWTGDDEDLIEVYQAMIDKLREDYGG